VFSYIPKHKEWNASPIRYAHFLALIAEENTILQKMLRRIGIDIMGEMEKFKLIGKNGKIKKERIFEVLGQCEGLELYAMLRRMYHFLMSGFGIRGPILIPFEPEGWKTALLKPPLIVFKDGIYTSGWSHALAEFLIEYNLFHYPLHDIMLGQEPNIYLPHSPLIKEEWRNRIWSRLQKIFSLTF
jgi:hypothetical protein